MSGEQDMVFDSEGDQNSADSFEKQLQQQELELQNQLREQELKNVPAPLPPTPWEGEATTSDMTNGSSKSEEVPEEAPAPQGVKRDSDVEADIKETESEEPPAKKGKLDEFVKLWDNVNDNPKDFQAWTNILQHIDQQSDLEGGRQVYPAFFERYPNCYGYWKKYADLEKRKGTREDCLKVFERGVTAIPLSVDLWVHFMDYLVNNFTEAQEENFVRQQFEKGVLACGLEFRSDKFWDAYINWEGNHKRWQRVTAVYDQLLATPTAKYVQHWTKFQEHVKKQPVTEVLSSEEFLALRRQLSSKNEAEGEVVEEGDEAPPGVEEDGGAPKETADTAAAAGVTLIDEEEGKNIEQLIISKREKMHLATTEAVKLRWTYEDAIKRPYFHVKPLERSQLQAWRDYLHFEIKLGDEERIRILFERCLIAAALYEEFWLNYIHYLQTLPTVTPEMLRNVFSRACNIHLKDKIKPQLSWALLEEEAGNPERSLELLQEVQERIPEALEPWVQKAALERRRGRLDDAEKVYLDAMQHFSSKNANILTVPHANLLIKYSRFITVFRRDNDKTIELLKKSVEEQLAGDQQMGGEQQHAVEKLLWCLFDRYLAAIDIPGALKALNMGTAEHFRPNTRLAFAHRRHQFTLEFGSSDMNISESGRQLQTLQQQLKQLADEEANTDKGSENEDASDAKKDKKKSDKAQGSQGDGGQQNGGYYGSGGQGYGQGGYQQYPPQTGTHQPPPQHPPPQGGQQNYSGYNQNYQQGSYPPQQYQGWGYPQNQGNYGYNQQQWSGYNNYYGQR